MNKLSKIFITIATLLAVFTVSACYVAPDDVEAYPCTYRKLDAYSTTPGYYLTKYVDPSETVDNVTVGGQLNGLNIVGVGDLSFRRSKNIAKVTLTDTILYIGNGAFADSDVAVVNLGKNICEIRDIAFSGCEYLASINLQNTSITAVNGGTFQNCTALTSITIPSGVTYIGEYAFAGCTALKTVYLPRTVTTLEVSCFKSLYVSSHGSCQIRYEGSEAEWEAITKRVGESYDDNTAGEPLYWYGMGELLYDVQFNCAN